MEKMKKTAGILDILCHILQICCIVAAVAALVGVLIVGAFFLIDLKPEQVATGYQSLDLGFLELTLAESAAPEPAAVLLNASVDMGLGAVMAVLAWLCVRCVRRVLSPMKEGLPFHRTAAEGTRKLAFLTILLGVVSNASDMISLFLTVKTYHPSELLLSTNVVATELNYRLDLTFLVVAAVLLLLSYIFSYGQQLQQLSDETL